MTIFSQWPILGPAENPVNYHFTVMPSGHDPIPLRDNQNRKGKWRQAKSTTTRSCRTTGQVAQGSAVRNVIALHTAVGGGTGRRRKII